MRLHQLRATSSCHSLLITSALPQDGKSTISLNLATALSEHGRRSVLLIEADLHHPTLTEELLLEPWPGLSDCLEERLNPLAAIRRVEPLGCHLLPAGEPHANPSELLQDDRLTEIMQEIRPNFDWILMDGPPLNPLTDALSLARHAEGSLLVVRAGRTPKSAVEQAITLLGPKHVVGMVLNGIDGMHRAYSKYYGYSSYSGKGAATTEAAKR
jgi:capsular exopolysaccharide synthesis family protein